MPIQNLPIHENEALLLSQVHTALWLSQIQTTLFLSKFPQLSFSVNFAQCNCNLAVIQINTAGKVSTTNAMDNLPSCFQTVDMTVSQGLQFNHFEFGHTNHTYLPVCSVTNQCSPLSQKINCKQLVLVRQLHPVQKALRPIQSANACTYISVYLDR